MTAILGFIPPLDRRLSIAIKSGNAANVVPNPATKPNTSERLKRGAIKLGASRRIRSLRFPHAVSVRIKRTIASLTLIRRLNGILSACAILARKSFDRATTTQTLTGYLNTLEGEA